MNYRFLAKLSTILLILYIISIVTTSVSNLGPMFFGGLLAFWIAGLQEKK